MWYEVKYRKLLSQVIRGSSFIFEKKSRFYWRGKPSNKVNAVHEEQDGIDVTGNLMDWPKLMFINEECGNLKLVVDGGLFTRNNNRKRKPEALQAYRCHSVKNAIDKNEVSRVFLAVTFFAVR